MALQKRFFFDGNKPAINKGSNVPPWNGNYNVENWYLDDTNYVFYNIVGNDEIFIQYGKNRTGWASARFLKETVTILNETENTDGSITASVRVQANFFVGRRNELASAGFEADYRVRINNQTQYEFSANTYDNFTYGSKPAIEFTVTVEPKQESSSSAMEVRFFYPNGEAPTSTFTVGFSLYNPNDPTYVPMTIRKNGSWKDLNSNNGKIKRRINNAWVDKSEENGATSRQINKGKNRIRINNEWRQLPKMNGGTSK